MVTAWWIFLGVGIVLFLAGFWGTKRAFRRLHSMNEIPFSKENMDLLEKGNDTKYRREISRQLSERRQEFQVSTKGPNVVVFAGMVLFAVAGVNLYIHYFLDKQ